MTEMTEEEWASVERALCGGGLRDCIERILSNRIPGIAPTTVQIRDENRRIMEEAWDDGSSTLVLFANAEEPPWFVGIHEGFEVCEGVERGGVIYTIVHQSGGGLVSVIVGSGLVENDAGVTFRNVNEAKAYIQGLTAK